MAVFQISFRKIENFFIFISPALSINTPNNCLWCFRAFQEFLCLILCVFAFTLQLYFIFPPLFQLHIKLLFLQLNICNFMLDYVQKSKIKHPNISSVYNFIHVSSQQIYSSHSNN